MKIALSVSEKEKAKGPESSYLRALLRAGAHEDELELVSGADAGRIRAENFDGILFAGGEDVDPSLYGEEKKYDSVHVSRDRDQFEMKLLDRALDWHLPILGICRGAQVINVGFGGTLYQDLSQDTTPGLEHQQLDAGKERNETVHGVTVTEPDSRLAGAFSGSCRVNSLHHQAIKRLGRGLMVTAHSEDGFVEAVEAADDYPFLLAVQWHPEEMADSPEQRRIFAEFIAECQKRSERAEGRRQESETKSEKAE